MKSVISNIFFFSSAIFIMMGIATIIKGDIEGSREGIFMAAFILFFCSIMVIAKWSKFLKLLSK